MSRLRPFALALVRRLAAPAAVLATATSAFAQSRDARDARDVAVFVEGTEASSIEGDVGEALPSGRRAQSGSAVASALAKAGYKGKLAAALAKPSERERIARIVRDAAPSGAVVVGAKKPGGGGQDALVLVVDGGSDGFAQVKLDKGKDGRVRALREALSGKLSPASGKADARAEPPRKGDEPAKAAPPGDDKPEKKADKADGEATSDKPAAGASAGGDAPRWLEASLGGDLVFRRFSYNDPLFGTLRPYAIDGGPSAFVGLTLFPITGTRGLRDIGIASDFARSLGLTSQTPQGTSVTTTFQRFRVGLRGRLRFGEGEDATVLGLDATYGRWKFDIKPVNAAGREAPSVDYTRLRLGADLRVPFGRVSLLAGVGYALVPDVGRLGERFPRTKSGEVDGKLGAAVRIVPSLEVRAWGEHARFFHALHPEPGDTNVAGGALDSYTLAHLDVTYYR